MAGRVLASLERSRRIRFKKSAASSVVISGARREGPRQLSLHITLVWSIPLFLKSYLLHRSPRVQFPELLQNFTLEMYLTNSI